ncbi:uroporphyrinogen-III synthase [Thiomicrospira sp. WB1]|uniref:uroporphyrinogen-III synthase n=1 Tax=Thiomicrospira sp. WB1 TaxID=1685380 RepID=UPI000749DD65|nr:uroporphyrinogen-III synthase [Thiomicrospira sp. WB1]KUJ71266.1 hypothetical protein AVO41_10460 [Thiomicrospira sp. WB1]
MTPTLLNTRPAGQAPALTQALEAAGFDSVECPVMAIEGVSLPETAVTELAQADKLVFVSRNAVEQLAIAWRALTGRELTPERDMKPGAQCFAIGAATQASLQAQGWPTAELAHEEFVSEALLARDDWQNLQGQQVVLVKGEGGRQALVEGLASAGATTTAWPVYRRRLAHWTAQAWQACWQSWSHARRPVVLISSWQGFEHLCTLVQRFGNQNDQAWLFQQAAIVFSDRIAQGLQQAGWQGPCRVARPQSQRGIIDALTQFQSE